jgi:hypothetical protein
MNWTVLNSEEITRQMKGHDLPPAVGQQFIASNCSALDLEEVFDRFSLSKDFDAAPIFKFAAEHSVTSERIQFA